MAGMGVLPITMSIVILKSKHLRNGWMAQTLLALITAFLCIISSGNEHFKKWSAKRDTDGIAWEHRPGKSRNLQSHLVEAHVKAVKEYLRVVKNP